MPNAGDQALAKINQINGLELKVGDSLTGVSSVVTGWEVWCEYCLGKTWWTELCARCSIDRCLVAQFLAKVEDCEDGGIMGEAWCSGLSRWGVQCTVTDIILFAVCLLDGPCWGVVHSGTPF